MTADSFQFESKETSSQERPQISPSRTAIVRFEDVCKRRGSHQALDRLNFEISKGEIVCLLGPNGAGKSTTIQHLLGLLSPDSGVIKVFEHSPSSLESRQRIGCTPQDSGFLEHVTLKETLELIAAHYPNPLDVTKTLEVFGLDKLAHRRTHALSGGQRRCLSLACAFVGNPDLVLLDEPTTGLDVDIRRRLWKVMREYAQRGGTILLTTHYLEEAEELASRILVMRQGRILLSGDVASIKAHLGLKQVEFNSGEDITISTASRVERLGDRYRIWTAHSDLVIRDLAKSHAFADLEVKSVKLEDAFMMLVSGADE